LRVALLRAIEILRDRIVSHGKFNVIAFARRSKAVKTKQMLEASPEHILREDKSPLAHERSQLIGLGLGKGVRIDAGIENNERMAQGLWQVASHKKRNAHLFQRVDEWERILWIRVEVGPKYCDLKRERFWKVPECVSVLVNDFEQWDFFGSQGGPGFGGKSPNGGAADKNKSQKGDC